MASVDPLQDREGFTWKDRGQLILRLGRCPGLRLLAHVLVQCCYTRCHPCRLAARRVQPVAFGISHGFGLFDYPCKSPGLAK